MLNKLAMFFYLSKILAFLLTPMVWITGLLLHTTLAGNPKWKKRSFRLALIVVVFFSNSFIHDEFMRAWEYDLPDYENIENHDIGLVLGGFLSYDKENDKINFFNAADRLTHAMELYQEGKIKKIMITSGSGTLVDYGYKEADIVRKFLLKMKIPDKDIIIENQSKNTRENAIYSAEIINESYNGNSVLLITSAFHMRRAAGCFKKVDLEVTPYAVDRITGIDRKFHFDHMIIPSVNALQGWTLLIHEVSGYIIYKIRGFA